MSEHDDANERRCVDCHRASPETASEYTLISIRYGWRLTRGRTSDGRTVLEWRCRDCFAAHRARAANAGHPIGRL